ncbi:MAG: hypothetical protein KF696_01140 [Planctomycetes bacterium]|nr:hypothetical protein [Planctomycetota bacterium]MCW8134456.1 hypothetical protein [Planctomycetota bacterium]
MEDDLKRFDLDAISKAFFDFVMSRKPQRLGKFFRDATGIRWRYIATTKTTYIATHGEYGVVMVVESKPDGTKTITVELKKPE